MASLGTIVKAVGIGLVTATLMGAALYHPNGIRGRLSKFISIGPEFATQQLETNVEDLEEYAPSVDEEGFRTFVDDEDYYKIGEGEVLTELPIRDSVIANRFGLDLSPDGNVVAFATQVPPGRSNGPMQIQLADLADESVIRITDVPRDSGCDRPSLSYDGKVVAFRREGKLYVADQRRMTLTEITNSENIWTGSSSVSFDGNIVAFSSEKRPKEIYVADFDQQTLTNVSNHEDANDTYPIISGDGTRAVFTSERNCDHPNNKGIYVANIETGTLRKVFPLKDQCYGNDNSYWIRGLDISEDGSEIKFSITRDRTRTRYAVNLRTGSTRKETSDRDQYRTNTPIDPENPQARFLKQDEYMPILLIHQNN